MCTFNNMAVTFLEQFQTFFQILLLLKMYILYFMLIYTFVHKGN